MAKGKKIFMISGVMKLDMAEFKLGLAESSRQLGRWAKDAGSKAREVSRSFGNLGKDMMILGGGAVVGLIAGLRELAAKGKELAEISKQLDISTTAAKQLQFAAKMGGLEFQDMAASISKMQKSLGSGSGDKALKALGMDPKAVKRMASDEAFTLIIDRLAGVGNANDRAALAMEIFGKKGFEMLRFVRDGKSELDVFLKKAREMGISMSPEKAAAMTKFIDTLKEFDARVSALGNTIKETLMPSLQWIYEKVNIMVGAFAAFIKNHPGIVKGFTMIFESVGLVTFGLGALFFVLKKVFGVWSDVLNFVKKLSGLLINTAKSHWTEAEAINAETAALKRNTRARTENNESKSVGDMLRKYKKDKLGSGSNPLSKEELEQEAAEGAGFAGGASKKGLLGKAGAMITGGLGKIPGLGGLAKFLNGGVVASLTAGIGSFLSTLGLIVGTFTTFYYGVRKLMEKFNLNKPVQDFMMKFMDGDDPARRDKALGSRSKEAIANGLIDPETGKRLVGKDINDNKRKSGNSETDRQMLDHAAGTRQKLEELVDLMRRQYGPGSNRAEVPLF